MKRNWFFYLNLFFLALGLFLYIPFFTHRSDDPVFGGYSLKYLVYVIGMGIPLLGYAVCVWKGSPKVQAILFVSIAFSALSLETMLRLLAPVQVTSITMTHPFIGFIGKPNISYDEPWKDLEGRPRPGKITFNEKGLRINGPIPMPKPKTEFRVLLLGGSTVMNGFPESNTISAQLEILFHQSGMNHVRVYNCGQNAFVANQEMSLLFHELLNYEADLVVCYDGGIDITSPYLHDPRPGYPYTHVALEAGHDAIRSLAPIRTYINLVLRKSFLIKLIYSRGIFYSNLREQQLNLSALRKSCGYGTPQWEEAIVNQYLSALEKGTLLANAKHFRFAAFLQPLVFFKENCSEREKGFIEAEPGLADYTRRQYDRARKGYENLQQKYGQDKTCYFYDISWSLRNYSKPAFTDFNHLDDAMNGEIAKILFDHLKKSFEFGSQSSPGKEITKVPSSKSASSGSQ